MSYSSWMFNSRSCDLASSPASIISCTFSLQIDKMAGIQLTDFTTVSLLCMLCLEIYYSSPTPVLFCFFKVSSLFPPLSWAVIFSGDLSISLLCLFIDWQSTLGQVSAFPAISHPCSAVFPSPFVVQLASV